MRLWSRTGLALGFIVALLPVLLASGCPITVPPPDLSGTWTAYLTATGGSQFGQLENPNLQPMTGQLRRTGETTYEATDESGQARATAWVNGDRIEFAQPANGGAAALHMSGTGVDSEWSSIVGTFSIDDGSLYGTVLMVRGGGNQAVPDLNGTWTAAMTITGGNQFDDVTDPTPEPQEAELLKTGSDTYDLVAGSSQVMGTAQVIGNQLRIDVEMTSPPTTLRMTGTGTDTAWSRIEGTFTTDDGSMYGTFVMTRGGTGGSQQNGTIYTDLGDTSGQLAVYASGSYDVWGGSVNYRDRDQHWWHYYNIDQQNEFTCLGSATMSDTFPGGYRYYVIGAINTVALDAVCLPNGTYTGGINHGNTRDYENISGPPDGATATVGFQSSGGTYRGFVVAEDTGG
ncbi:MAG: hypothetical protein KKB50_13425 [Planctomycetes bacterium]|nr:hypothetical protein [Planctomycetota bacterium]